MVENILQSIRTQLTVARWHLDAAISSDAESAREHQQRAREAFEEAVRVLARTELDTAQRQGVEQELFALRSRLKVDSKDAEDKPQGRVEESRR